MRFFILSGTVLLLHLLSSCSDKSKEMADASFANLIPKPVKAERGKGYFRVPADLNIYVSAADSSLLRAAQQLKLLFSKVTKASIQASGFNQESPGIHLQLVNDSSFSAEGYELAVSDSSIHLTAHQPAGIFYGIQTLRQLLPPSAETNAVQKNWWIATGTIKDQPLYKMRGAMLDVARHFFGVDDVKRYIDFLAAYKMNVLHLHLSDDQGWRIEIKKWPKLTAIGGSTQVGGGKGGFYTQEQYREIVQYAAERFITVIPEIDMPGHTNAALASYPELNCNPKDTLPRLYTGTEVGFSTFCTTNETVYGFVDDVLGELAAVTPGPYLHVGGDESLVTPEKEYIAFMNRVQSIVAKHGKKVIGWDEIAKTSLQPGTIAQYWNDSANAVHAVQQGARIMMSPAKRVYMDMQYDSTTRLGLHWAAYIEVDQAYNWNPATLVPGISQQQIAGIIAPLWTETILNIKDIEYMVFPRLLCYAEIGWSPADHRKWEEYRQRLGYHGVYLQAKNINFYQSKLVDWKLK